MLVPLLFGLACYGAGAATFLLLWACLVAASRADDRAAADVPVYDVTVTEPHPAREGAVCFFERTDGGHIYRDTDHAHRYPEAR